MKHLKAIRILAWCAVFALSVFLLERSFFQSRVAPQTVGAVTSADLAAIGGPFELKTHKGEVFTQANVFGRPFLVFFGFTHCPDVCPTTLYELTELMKGLGPDANRLTPLFIAVDSQRDNQATLAPYMTSFDDRIIALWGTSGQVDAVVKSFKAYYRKVPQEDGSYSIEHTAGVLLVNADGKFAGTLDMHEPREAQIAKLRRLLK